MKKLCLEDIITGLKKISISKWKAESDAYVLELSNTKFLLYENLAFGRWDYTLKIEDLKSGLSFCYNGAEFDQKIRPFYKEIDTKLNDYSQSRIMKIFAKIKKKH